MKGKMDQRKAFFFFGFMVLVWTVFWNGAARIWATKHAANSDGSSPAASGLLVVI